MTSTTEILEGTPGRRPSARLRFGVAFLVGLVAALVLGVGAIYAYDQQYAGRILPGVRVGATDLSGMSPDEARAALAGAYRGLSDGRIVLTTPNGQVVVAYAEIGRSLDTDRLVEDAMAVGRHGTAIDRAVANARTAIHGVTLSPRVVFDAKALEERVKGIAEGLSVAPVDASVRKDDKLRFAVVTGSNGRMVDPAAPTQSVTAALSELDAPAEVTAEVPAYVVEPAVTNVEAANALAAATRMVARIDLTVDDRSVAINTTKLRTWVTFRTTADGGYEPVLDASQLPALLTTLAPKIDQAAVNASFKVSGGTITGVTPSRRGYTLDVPATAAAIEDLVAARATGATTTRVQPVVAVAEPVLTTEEAKAAAPKMRKISEHTTYFPITIKNGFGANIWIPALTIDGYVVGPGETFDFWDAVGEVTTAKGYRQGGAIINGKTEPQGALAGGICSCSTTLFNAALKGGFEMGDRRNHYYYIDRYPLGLDATVFISASGSKQTMSWTNDTEYPVLIRGYKIRKGNSGFVKFVLYSVPTGRKVVIGKPTVKNIRPASDTVQYTTSLPPGATQRVEYPVDGKQVWRTVTVYDRSGAILHQRTYYSNYSRITGILLVGKSTTPDTTPDTPPPPPTD